MAFTVHVSNTSFLYPVDDFVSQTSDGVSYNKCVCMCVYVCVCVCVWCVRARSRLCMYVLSVNTCVSARERGHANA